MVRFQETTSQIWNDKKMYHGVFNIEICTIMISAPELNFTLLEP